MKCKAIMKYSFNQNQTIPKHIKKKVTAFCFSLSLSLQKFHFLEGSVVNRLGMLEKFLPDRFPSVKERKL